MSIGCLECEVETHVIGVFDSQETAMAGLKEYEDRHYWRGKKAGSDICNVIKVIEDSNEAQLAKVLEGASDA